MITLYKFIPAWGLPDLSPFCVKLETYLKMAGVPYKTEVGDSRKAPKQKLPYIDHDGRKIGDSSLVIEYLKQSFGDPLDAHLVSKERAIAQAYKSMIEEHLYFVILYQRWQEDAGWEVYQPTFGELLTLMKVPALMRGFLLSAVRKVVVKSLRGQGLGRHSPEEIDTMGKQIVTSIAEHIGRGPFFFGDKPASIDATVYGFLASLMEAPFPSNVRTFACEKENLRAYCARMKSTYWSA